ncbi:hypothetical protein HispidOSU_008930, partial [Sigmodon hispidus]
RGFPVISSPPQSERQALKWEPHGGALCLRRSLLQQTEAAGQAQYLMDHSLPRIPAILNPTGGARFRKCWPKNLNLEFSIPCDRQFLL